MKIPTENTFGTNIVAQIAIVVRDIEKTAGHWAVLLGVSAPEIRETSGAEITNIRYRGEATEGRAKLAFFHMDNISIELIEPIGGPSTWREALEKNGDSVHHIALRVKGADDIVAALDSQGMPLAQSGDFTGGRYRYIDSVDKLGLVLELLEKKSNQ